MNSINELQQRAVTTRLGIPIFYGIDAIHGNNNVYGATIFPHNIVLEPLGKLVSTPEDLFAAYTILLSCWIVLDNLLRLLDDA